MKTSIKVLMAIPVLLSATACTAQIKNTKTETVKIYGNCGMCKKTIETAGNQKHIADINWDTDSKMATIRYDSLKTNREAILKRVALSGYDSDQFLAPNEAYAELPGCCQYERAAKPTANITHQAGEEVAHADHTMAMNETKAEPEQLKGVFAGYFAVKDALVKTDGKAAAAAAKELVAAIAAVKMASLTPDVHTVWMKAAKTINFEAEHIAETNDVVHQRDHFSSLSSNVYILLKAVPQESPSYYQHCPMANNGKGADWLSKENTVKNPYYGSQMMSCGKTVETIK